MGQQHFLFVDESDEIRQGDVICRKPSACPETPTMGLVITADCDIAQRKAGGRFTWVEIVTAKTYVEGPWAVEQIRKLTERQGEFCAKALSAIIRRARPELEPLTRDSVCLWLKSNTAEEILELVGFDAKSGDPKLKSTLLALRTLLEVCENRSNIDRLRSTWTRLGHNAKAQQAMIKGALDGNGGFPDYFLITEIPTLHGYGFVVLLRAISSVVPSDVFGSELEARINGRPDAFFRICRLDDRMKYAIVQRMTFLFSRIGMLKEYETACETVIDILVEELYDQVHGETK